MDGVEQGDKQINTHTQPFLHRCWTQRCSRRLGCRPGCLLTAERNQTGACCPDGKHTETHWREGTAAGQGWTTMRQKHVLNKKH